MAWKKGEKIQSVFRLIRLPNVLIVILTQCLLQYCIFVPFIFNGKPGDGVPAGDFFILVLVTALITVGGYVINDYFDVKIDRINRPGRQAVGELISPRGAIFLHIVLNGVAILLGFYLAFRVKAFSIGLIFPFISGLLWIYSAKYKRMIFWGNFIVSFLSAFVILILWLFNFFWLRIHPSAFASSIPVLRWVTLIFLGYALFAFLLTLVREIIKDMEDTEGDAVFGCKTLPLVAGMHKSKLIVAALLALTIMLLGVALVKLYILGLILVFWYFVVAVMTGAVFILVRLFLSKEKKDFHFLSQACKLVMLAGILSMEVIFLSI